MLRTISVFTVATGALLSVPRQGSAEEPLTLDRVITLAREQAPRARIAALKVEETRGRLAGARPALAANPTVNGALGRRLDGPRASAELEGRLEVVQPLEIGGQRGARVSAAEAATAASAALSDHAVRQVEADAAVAFFRILHAMERLRIATATEATAGQFAQSLERRHQLGDVPVLDVNVAKTAQARAGAQVRGAVARKTSAEADLRRVLGWDPVASIEVTGDLRATRHYELDALLARAPDRGDVRALLAEVREAQADARLGQAARWPGLGIGAMYERHEGANLALGALTVELPVFARGQELQARGTARARRLDVEADALKRSAASDVRAAHMVYQDQLSAVAALASVQPLTQENEDLARKSYEAGQLSLADWLVVRREALDTRVEYFDQLLIAAEAGAALALSAGVSP